MRNIHAHTIKIQIYMVTLSSLHHVGDMQNPQEGPNGFTKPCQSPSGFESPPNPLGAL